MKDKKRLKEQKGIIVSDAMIAILIILLFAGIITSLITNIVKESTKIKMDSQQMDFATEIFEYMEKLPYESVTEETLISYINSKGVQNVSAGTDISTLTTSYKIQIKVQKYNETEGNTDKLDLIKIVTVTIENNIDDEPYTTEISRVKKASMNEVEEMLNE